MESKSVTMELAPDARLAPRSLADVPGPRGWPLLGNLPQMTASRIHRDVEDWARRYGPLFKLRFGPLPVLVVARHESVNAVLRDRPDGFRRPRVTANVSDELGGRPGLFLAEGKAWREGKLPDALQKARAHPQWSSLNPRSKLNQAERQEQIERLSQVLGES